jgi:uncharacterized protein YjeT (DUF2065 family)
VPHAARFRAKAGEDGRPMKPALGFLLALLTIEGLMLLLWPAHLRAIIQHAPEKTLRIVGIVELILVLLILVTVCRLF